MEVQGIVAAGIVQGMENCILTCAVVCLAACTKSEAPARPHVTTYILGSHSNTNDHVVCCFTIPADQARKVGVDASLCACYEESSYMCEVEAIGIPGVSKPTWSLVQSFPE
jgi:hypothetical protein